MKPRIVIQFTVTAKEKRAIQRAAKFARMNVSQWLRHAATHADRAQYEERQGLTT